MSALPLQRLRQTVAPFAEARLVVLFGSVGRDEAAPWSDLDLGVSGLDFWRGLELGAAAGAVLGREAHVVDLEEASDWLRFRVAAEGIVLHEGEADAWATFVARAMLGYYDVAPIIGLCAEGARHQLAKAGLRRG